MPRVSVQYSQTSKATYNRFCEANPTIKITYLQYSNIIYAFNYGFRDYIYETGDKGKLPFGFGDFVINKYKPKIDRLLGKEEEGKKSFIPVDWKKTKELGRYVYHLNLHSDGWKYKFQWNYSSARFKGYKLWWFKPSRVTSRTLRHYINQEQYRNKYLTWSRK